MCILLAHLHQLFQTGEIDVIDAFLWRRSDVLLDVGSVHKRQVDLLSHVGRRQDDHVGIPSKLAHLSIQDKDWIFVKH